MLIAPLARSRDVADTTVRASGLSEIDLETLLQDLTEVGIDTGAFDAPVTTVTLGDVPALILYSRHERVVSLDDGKDIGSSGTRFIDLDSAGEQQIFSGGESVLRVAELSAAGTWLGDVGGRELYPTLDYA